ncbi:MAG TPA: MFS transporter [Steroidobacteraceae bacterium]|nr:MFS transporter [Steroidobacteraceae bacterium]
MKQATDIVRARHRENIIVAVLALGFGLVGIDRFLITTLFPVIARDLHLDYGDIGVITGALAIAWGIAALFVGNLSDRIGRRRVLTASLVVFSLLIGASGMATGLIGLIAVRLVMGIADGAYTPASIAGTLDASGPGRRGFNIGIQQMMLPLFGLGLAPLIVAGVLRFIDWRWIFLVFVPPGLAVARAVWLVIPEPRSAPEVPRVAAAATGVSAVLAAWKAVLGYSNIRIAALLMLCWLTCLITTSAFLPNYLVDYLKLPLPQMGTVMSAIGLGATVGTFLLASLSDRLGRKPVLALSAAGALLSLVLLANTGAHVGLLFASLFFVHFFNNALITLTVGPLCSEAVPVALMATASGLVIAVGELFGGGIAPVLVGHLAQRLGVDQILKLPIVMLGVGLLLCLTIHGPTTRMPLILRRPAP